MGTDLVGGRHVKMTYVALAICLVISALAIGFWSYAIVNSEDEARSAVASRSVFGWQEMDFGTLIARYEQALGQAGEWRVQRNRSIVDSLLQGDEDGYTWVVRWIAPAERGGGDLEFRVGPFGHISVREPGLDIPEMILTADGPAAAERYKRSVQQAE